MEPETRQVFLGLGSNINPGHAVSQMLLALLNVAPTVHVSRVVRTAPVGMASPNHFLNLSAHLSTTLSQGDLKARLNQIEVALGRDRSDPLSAVRDRPADIDILFELPAAQRHVRADQLPAEPYVRPAFLELAHALGFVMPLPALPMRVGVPIRVEGRIVGLQPSALTRRQDSRLIVLPLSFQAPTLPNEGPET